MSNLLCPQASMMRAGIVVAEAWALVREGLVGLLATWPHGPVRPAASLAEAITLLETDAEAVLLLDLELLGDAGPAGLQAVRARFPALRIVALAPQETRDGILACLAAGAHGYIAKTAGFAELARAIEAVHAGGVHVPSTLAAPAPAAQTPPPRTASPSTLQAPVTGLTGRQQDVLRLLAEGRSTKDIARTLDLAVSTIKVHLAALYRVVGARNRIEALCRAGCVASVGSMTVSVVQDPFNSTRSAVR